METKKSLKKKDKPSSNSTKVPYNKPFLSISKNTIYWLIGIIALTFVLYYPSLFNDFLYWDDPDYITKNEAIKNFSFGQWRLIFGSFYASNYHPFVWIMHGIEYSLFGLDPIIYHLVNVIIHLINTILVFWFVLILLKNERIGLLVALLFAIHPMHVESVAWISERKDVLYCFFYVLALIHYIKYLHANNNKGLRLGIVLLLFICSLFSKSAAMTLPPLLILLDYYFGRKLTIKVWLEKIPFFLLSITFGILAIYSQKAGGALGSISNLYSPLERLFFVNYALAYYIIHAVFPFYFSALHPYPLKLTNILPWYFYAAPIFIAFLAIIYSKIKRNKQIYLLGIMLFLIPLSVVLQIIPVGQAIVAERYTYFPYIGLFIIIAWKWDSFWNLYKDNKQIKILLIALLIGFNLYYIFQTHTRIGVWKNSITLFDDIIAKSPYNALPYNNRGMMKADRNLTKEAIEDFNKAISLYPNYDNAYNNRAKAWADLEDYQKAMDDYNTAIKINPNFLEAYHNRALLKDQLGDYEGAVSDFNFFLSQRPNEAKAYRYRANTYAKMGKFDKAIEDFSIAIKMMPNSHENYYYRGMTYANMGKLEQAIADFTTAISIYPAYYQAYNDRAKAKGSMNKLNESLNDFNQAILLNPNFGQAYYNRGIAQYKLNNFQEACKDWQKAVENGFTPAKDLLMQMCR